MDEQSKAPEQALNDLQKNFKLVGSHRVHAWYAWAIVGVMIGMFLGIIYVANRSLQFDAGQAFIEPVTTETVNLAFHITAPEQQTHIETNPHITVAFDPALVPARADFRFSYAQAAPDGTIVGQFKPLSVSRYRSKYQPGYATYVANNFESLAPATYVLRASLSPFLPNAISDTVVVKDPGPQTATTGSCSCKDIRVDDLGAVEAQHRLRVVAQLAPGSNPANCTEYQKIKATFTVTDENSQVGFFATDAGVNAFMSQEEVDKANDETGSTIQTYPYSGDSFTDDDFTAPSDEISSDSFNKIHSTDQIEWWDIPGIVLSRIAPQDRGKGVTLTYNATLQHVVQECECKTGVHITFKDGKVTLNKLDPICE